MKALDTQTPVLVLGGKENSLSIVRHLSGKGIKVSVSGPANCWGLNSRFTHKAYRVPAGENADAYWSQLLLGQDRLLDGHMLMPCSDEAIEFVARHHNALMGRYLLDEGQPGLRHALLDKMETLRLARQAGVPTPNFWPVSVGDDLSTLEKEISFPVMVKPINSHLFSQVFGAKLFIIEGSFAELTEKVGLAHGAGLDVMIVEMIPGPDHLLSSYYTYIDGRGAHLFDFTKRIERRYPTNRGGACYHATEWLPETAEMGRRFFQGIGFTGLGNIEFKRDPRDGQLKVIEANARFTAAQELALRAGMPIDLIVYRHLTGQAVPRISSYREGLHYWYPIQDFLAFVELRLRGEISLWGWLSSVFSKRRVAPLLSLSDMQPVGRAIWSMVRRAVRARA